MVKAMNYLKITLLLVFLSGCRSRNDVTLEISNSSQVNFDSAVGLVNDHKFLIKTIEPGKIITLNIPISSIKLNGNDFMLHLNLFSKNLKDTLTGMFYTDLGGNPGRKYLIDISAKKEVGIAVEY